MEEKANIQAKYQQFPDSNLISFSIISFQENFFKNNLLKLNLIFSLKTFTTVSANFSLLKQGTLIKKFLNVLKAGKS